MASLTFQLVPSLSTENSFYRTTSSFKEEGWVEPILKTVPDFTAPVFQAKRAKNIIVRDLTIDGVKTARLLLSIWYTDNVLVERVRARRAAGTGI